MSSEAVIKSLKTNLNNLIVGCDIYPKNWIATSQLVDTFYQTPRIDDPNAYILALQKICIKERIEFIIPLTDPEVDVISQNRLFFIENGIQLCISNEKCIEICRNKLRLFDFFKNDDIVNTISTFHPDKLYSEPFNFPLIAKPFNGRSSEGIFKMYSEIDLKYFLNKYEYENYIIQPLLNGDIFTVDFIRSGILSKSFCIIRKELLRTINGAGLSVQLIEDKNISEMANQIGEKLDIKGCVNFEFINHKGKYYLMDINPRFSAGVAFSNLAGYDFVKNHLNCFANKEIELPIKYTQNFISKRYSEIIIKN